MMKTLNFCYFSPVFKVLVDLYSKCDRYNITYKVDVGLFQWKKDHIVMVSV